MSGRRAKRKRQAERNRPTHVKNAELVDRAADAVLAVDLSDIVLNDRVPQVVVGICRAAAAQSKVVAMLTAAGNAASAAPNRRLVLEAAIRLLWLAGLSRDERRQAVDIMLEKDRNDTNSTLGYLSSLGQTVDFDPTEMNEFELIAPTKGTLQEQTRKLDAAVRATEVEPWSLYAMWREETKSAHPSGSLAGQYAPTFDDKHLSSGEPSPMDADLEAHQLIQFLIVMTTRDLLIQDGVSRKIADRIPEAFHANSPTQFEWPE